MTAYHVAVAPPALLLIVAPALWPWALAVGAFVALAYLWDSRRRLAHRVVGLELELAAYEYAAAKANLDAVREIVSPLHRDGKGTHLSVVPPQRDGSEYEWPRLARAIEHDDLTALMRATEED